MLLACVLTAAMVAGVAVASPRAFDRVVEGAKRAVLGEGAADERTGGGRDPDTEGASGSPASDRCAAIVDAYRAAAPPSDDASALQHAIEVVHANCERHPQAKGLVNALERLARNAERKAEREAEKAERKAEKGDRRTGGRGGDSGGHGPPSGSHAGGNGGGNSSAGGNGTGNGPHAGG